MASVGGANSNFELDLNRRLKDLEKRIAKHQSNIKKILVEAYASPSKANSYWVAVRKKLDIEYKALASIYTTWSKIELPKAYRRSLAEIMGRLNRSKEIASRASRNFTQMATSTRATTISNALYLSANRDYIEALAQGKNEIFRITRRTQQLLVAESLIDEKVAEAIQAGNLAGANRQELVKLFKDASVMIENERFVMVNGRKYTPEYYAEMVSRVKFHEAQAYAAVETAGNYGTSLVKVSNHNTDTPICQVHENKIYSIGGKDSRFPTLQTVPPFHPNCLHLLFPTFESGMEATGTLDQWSNFSKGETGVPPAPKNFIPVSERGD